MGRIILFVAFLMLLVCVLSMALPNYTQISSDIQIIRDKKLVKKLYPKLNIAPMNRASTRGQLEYSIGKRVSGR